MKRQPMMMTSVPESFPRPKVFLKPAIFNYLFWAATNSNEITLHNFTKNFPYLVAAFLRQLAYYHRSGRTWNECNQPEKEQAKVDEKPLNDAAGSQ